jgi:uncharacterized OB-fold protein
MGTGASDGRPHSIAQYRKGYEEEQRLRGLRSGCGFVTATWGLRCPRCGDHLEDVDLPRRGRIEALTVQTVPSDEFLNDAPYAYVVVALEGGGRVTGWMAGVGRESELPIGTVVELGESYRPGVQFHRVGPGPTPRG